MNLVVMIPCLNEEHTLPEVIRTIPATIPGITSIETLIIDDGSTDKTVEVALSLGVNYVVKLKRHLGLARAFQAGLDACLDLGADIIVNTDGDNQYPSGAIPELVRPILRGEADIVIGDRQTQTITEFSLVKKLLQRVGSWTIRKLSGASEVKDAVSGFRAYSRYAASRIYLTNSYSYTIESIIQAGKRSLTVVSVPIKTNPKTRPSHLFRSIRGFVTRSGTTRLRSYLLYEPLKVFNLLAAFSLFLGVGLGGRFVYLEFTDRANSHMLSLILAGFFFIEGLFLAALGMVTDHIAANRKLLEELVWREKARRQRLLDSTLGVGTLNWNSNRLVAEAPPQRGESKAPATVGKHLDDAIPQLTVATGDSE